MMLARQIEDFRGKILAGGVLDPEGVHHEFVSGAHGQKLDFDLIPTYEEGTTDLFSPLYKQWVDTTAAFIHSEFPETPDVILGVANGTNRLAEHVAHQLEGITGQRVSGFATEKDAENSKVLRIPSGVRDRLLGMWPGLVVVLEDVGTTGSQSVQIANQAKRADHNRVVVIPTWQRQQRLTRLDESGIEYRAIIHEPLPTYSPEDCVKTGFCAQGWEFIPRNT